VEHDELVVDAAPPPVGRPLARLQLPWNERPPDPLASRRDVTVLGELRSVLGDPRRQRLAGITVVGEGETPPRRKPARASSASDRK